MFVSFCVLDANFNRPWRKYRNYLLTGLEVCLTDIDGATNKEKDAAWSEIANSYNCQQITGIRTIRQLKSVYDVQKRKARKDKSDYKVELYKTGGGRNLSMLSSTTDKVIGILGDRLEPLSNQYDCDSDYPIVIKCGMAGTGFRGENWANHTGGLCPMSLSPRCPTSRVQTAARRCCTPISPETLHGVTDIRSTAILS
ncbi:uncharacterized protein LOC126550175 isoform X2 [Aphis gossypii]|uniref:uncharacterized protein LOC126550175 isoform X2 n=1 Tax=Aphis gossypii TaxID=80765 RepID=UPI0021598642|nr:uncharacterized protein LOC126550175 isoform X2 [Aphis gossypii]